MENNSKCGICQTVFDKLVLLRKHVRVDHKLQYANHRCPHCRFGCYINTDLESHKVQKHPDLKQYHCQVCNTGRVFFSESDYQVIFFKVENFLRGSLDSIPSPSMKIQIVGGKVCLRCK